MTDSFTPQCGQLGESHSAKRITKSNTGNPTNKLRPMRIHHSGRGIKNIGKATMRATIPDEHSNIFKIQNRRFPLQLFHMSYLLCRKGDRSPLVFYIGSSNFSPQCGQAEYG